MAEHKAFEIRLTEIAGIEARGWREYVDSVTASRAAEGLAPFTEAEWFELKIAFNCGCRHIEDALAKRGAIFIDAPTPEGSVPRG